MSTHTPLRVIIIGAGTGGLCLAQALKRAGIDVHVFERDRTRRDGLQGYRVGISPAGSYALQQCLPPELYQLFVATCARPPRYFNMLTEQLKEVLSVDVPNHDDPVDSEKSVSRMTLRQVLLTGLEDTVAFDKKFSLYRVNSDGTVTAFFEDGTNSTGDLLIGADGANSRVRKQRLPDARMEETGIVSIGGKMPLTRETRSLLSEKVIHGVSLIAAPKGAGAIIHVMEFPWRRAGGEHAVGGNDSNMINEWPGLLYDNTRDYVMWGVWAARERYRDDPTKMNQADQLRTAAELTSKWHPNVRRLVELTDPTTVFSVNIRTSVPVAPWVTSNITLLGDAIHTMTPGRGVGANTALRDAELLSRQLIQVRDGKQDLIPALHAYEAEMLRYSAIAVLNSRKEMDANDILHKPIVGRAKLAIMRTGMRVVNGIPALKRKIIGTERNLRRIQKSEVQQAL